MRMSFVIAAALAAGVAFADGAFHPCVVRGRTQPGAWVVSNCGQIAQAEAVRYLFNSPWQGSVFNEASLPLGPFMMPTLHGNSSLERD